MAKKVARLRMGAAASGGDGDAGSREQAAARALATLRGEVAPRAAPLAIVDPPVLAALRGQLPIGELLDCTLSRIIQIPQSMQWQGWYHHGLTVAEVLSSRRSVRGPLRSAEVPNSVALELYLAVGQGLRRHAAFGEQARDAAASAAAAEPQDRGGRAIAALRAAAAAAYAREGAIAPPTVPRFMLHRTDEELVWRFTTVHHYCRSNSGKVIIAPDLRTAAIRCDCGRTEAMSACSNEWRMAWALADLLQAPHPASDLRDFSDAIRRAPHEALLEALAVLDADSEVQDAAAVALGWRLKMRHSGEAATIDRIAPLRVSATKTGKPSLRQLRLAELDGLAHLFTAADRELVTLLETSGGKEFTNHYSSENASMRLALQRLIGHRHCYDGANNAPLLVETRTLVLELRGEGEGARMLATVDGEAVDAAALSTAQRYRAAHALRMLRQPGGARLQLLELPRRLRPTLARLPVHGVLLPAEALPAVRGRFARISALLPVRADEAVLGAAVAADPQPWLRLTLADVAEGEVAVTAELAVRPLDGGVFFPPGEGEPLVFAAAAADASHTRRDLPRERAEAEALARTLELPGAAATLHGEAALELVARAGELPGLRVLWERDSVRARRGGGFTAQVRVRSRTDWLELGGKLELDGESIELALALQALREGRRWVRLGKGGWARLEGALAEVLEGVAVRAEGEGEAVRLPALGAALLEGVAEQGADVQGDRTWVGQRDRLREARALPAEPPAELAAELRDYQRHGIAWLRRMAHWAPGAVLADDMGLGKTLQALALLLARAAEGPALVVAPTSLGFGWQREAARFAPALTIRAYRGGERAALLPGAPGEVLVTSYDLLYRDIDALAEVDFATVVLDEAQALKNPHSRRARAATRLQAGFRLALSGTPVENHASDLWSLLRATVPGLLPGWERFRQDYALPIERQAQGPARRALAGLVGPFVLRRRKREVLRELPERVEVRADVVLSRGERTLYDAVRAEAKATVEHGTPEQRRFAVLAALTKLRQVACHPRLVEPQSPLPSAKHARLRELVAELREEGQQALVFSQFVRQLELAREALTADGARLLQLDGSTPAAQRGAVVDAFQRGEADVLLLSLKAGGTGLNLTAASTVILLDPWWNPAVEAQAGDRAHRIGQEQQVTIVRLVALATVEDAILALQQDKRELTEALLAGADGGARLDTEALLALLSADSPDAALALVAAVEDAAGGVEHAADDAANDAAGDGAAAPVAAPAKPPASEPLLQALATALDAAVATGAIRKPQSARTVLRVAERLVAFARVAGLGLDSAEEVDAAATAYARAVGRGVVVAPGSDRTFAKNAANWLRRVVGAQNDPSHSRPSDSTSCQSDGFRSRWIPFGRWKSAPSLPPPACGK